MPYNRSFTYARIYLVSSPDVFREAAEKKKRKQKIIEMENTFRWIRRILNTCKVVVWKHAYIHNYIIICIDRLIKRRYIS